jgi:ankyrin repeat protein
LTSASELHVSKHLTTFICPYSDTQWWDVVKCLLSSGADVYLCDRNKQSPLFVASMSGHCDVVKCLRSSGADVNLCDRNGQHWCTRTK